MSIISKIEHIYDKKYKQLMLITFGILLLSIGVIGVHWVTTGDFIDKGISLKGGTTITVQTDKQINIDSFQADARAKFPADDVNARELSTTGRQVGLIVETTNTDSKALVAYVKEKVGEQNNINVETIGPSLGASFFKQTVIAIAIAFVLMSIVVFIYFRQLMPSSYIILCAFSDIIFPWAVLILFHIKLSTAGVAAFLMLTGYSVDTDILLTTRVLKREGTIFKKIVDAFKTGSIMTLAAMAATGIAYFATPSETLKQIMMILFIGLCADLWNTWIQNAGLLRWWLESKQKKVEDND